MSTPNQRSREIIEILGDVAKRTSDGCLIVVPKPKGGFMEMACPGINYTFGNAQYVKDQLDTLSKTEQGRSLKFPLIALFCPFNEQRNLAGFYSKAMVRVLIACSSSEEWSNEVRLQTSFRNILRPIYNRFLEALKEDGRFDFGYDEHISHEYSENYSYGRYGAYTGTGDALSEPIDAINISNLELKVKLPNCRKQ